MLQWGGVAGKNSSILHPYITYPRTLNTKFDIIIIDGIFRNLCAKEVSSLLNVESSEGAMVVLDNADWHQNTAKFLRNEVGLIEVDFHGFSPINDYTLTTSIFLSRNFCFKYSGGISPHYSLAALHHKED